MKALLVFLVLIGASACGQGFSVQKSGRDPVTYYCTQFQQGFSRDLTLRICDTLSECNDYCDKIRKEKQEK